MSGIPLLADVLLRFLCILYKALWTEALIDRRLTADVLVTLLHYQADFKSSPCLVKASFAYIDTQTDEEMKGREVSA